MAVNQSAHHRTAAYGRLLLPCLACGFIAKVAGEDSCLLPATGSNASSLLQVHKPQPEVQAASTNTLLEKASHGSDSNFAAELMERLDESLGEDAKLRKANADLEKKVVEEHDEVQRLKVLVERLYKDKMNDDLKQGPAKKQTEVNEDTSKEESVKTKTEIKTPPKAEEKLDDTRKEESVKTKTEIKTPPKAEEKLDDSEAPCKCEFEGTDWKRPAQRQPRCIFIDLGAADGNTFSRFLANGFGDVGNCPSHGSYEAILVEANPVFNKPLQSLEKNFSGRVKSVISTAAYMCEGKTSFYLDTVDVEKHFWGSSMSPNARDVQRSGKRKVTVPLLNLNRLLWETAIKEDYVLVKMDIEGSEHDILPCLAKSGAAELVDALYVEQHPVEWSRTGAKEGSLQKALTIFKERGVTAPFYDSPML